MADQEFELELSEETLKTVAEYAQKTNQSEEQVIEYILKEFISNQFHVIEKRAKEVNEPVQKLVNMQFAKIADYLNSVKKA